MSEKKFCFMDAKRPCDLTCKAAFEVDDPVDNVDCYFIWLSHHFGEGLFEVRRLLELAPCRPAFATFEYEARERDADRRSAT